MPNHNQLLKAAEELGSEHGDDAASWYFYEGRHEVTRADYLRVLKGIEDGDPEILDTFPDAPLSGEFADSMTPQRLYEQLGVSEAQLRDWESTWELEALCRSYEDAWAEAVEASITQQCRMGARIDVAFRIEVTLEEQDPDKLLSMLTDLLARENCDLIDDSWEES